MKPAYEVLAWALFAVVVGLLSVWPRYEIVEEQYAIITLTFSHAAQRVGECRILSQAELDELPPNMRQPADCPRERHPVRLELRSDETVLYEALMPPSGVWDDGKANVYRRVIVPAGRHELFVGMNDSGTAAGFDYEQRATLDIEPGRNVVVRFDETAQRFTIL